MAVVLGAAAALGFGCADFLGGIAARRTHAATVILGTQASGLLIAVALVAIDGAPFPAAGPAWAAVGAGISGATGLGLLFRGLATGRMYVVAPVSAVLASAMPVGWGIVQGERPSTLALTGVVIATVGVGLVARPAEEATEFRDEHRRSLAMALAAGVAFGVAVSLFSEASQDAAFWPLPLARAASIPAIVGFLLVTRTAPAVPPGARSTIVASGILDVSGNAALVTAFRSGLTSLVAPVVALYPVATVLLARIVLTERITPHQRLGLALAFPGLVIIAAG